MDIVPNQRRSGRLYEGGGFTDGDVEALPVDIGTVGGVDSQLGSHDVERSASLSNTAAQRIREGIGESARECQVK